MQDPSHGLAQQLQNHVHLISGHRFPLLPSLNLEQAFRYLLDAPTIVKQTAPMAWNYIAAPQDGTVWLEWISPRNGEYRFPSDGYVWGDAEQAHRREFGGYSIEMMIHTVGYRPGFDQVASHARTRYHFVAKNPSVNAAPPDPSLWIVHYHSTDQHSMLPVNQLQLTAPMRQILTERRWLETQGRLERKDFMLHDREHWPTINVPGHAHMQQPGMYANPMMQQQMNQQRFPQYSYPSAQGPPAKRARHSGPNAMPGSSDGVHDSSLEDEENTSQGDFFDFLSPREISMARYVQHHRWMEEVFSSPYASSQIVPPDLGLGIMGELKGLTDGILPPPSVDELGGKPSEKPTKAKDAQPFTNLKKEQIDEFNKRVEKHLEQGHAEIERMKKEHTQKMAEWKKSSFLMQAEKRLRYATWEGHEGAVPAYRLWSPPPREQGDEGAPTETVEDVVRDVERTLGVKIKSHKVATLVEKGGLEKEEEQLVIVPEAGVNGDQEISEMQQQEVMMSGANGTGIQTQPEYNLPPPSADETKGQVLASTMSNDLPQPTFGEEHANREQPDAATNQVPPPVPDDMGQHNPLNNMGGMDAGDDSFMDDVDMNVDTGDIDFIEHDQALEDEPAGPSGVSDVTAGFSAQPDVQGQEAQDAGVASISTLDTSPTAIPVTLGEAGEQQAPMLTQGLQQPAPTMSGDNTTPAEPPLNTTTLPQASALADNSEPDPAFGNTTEPGLFDDGTFDDLTNMDDGNGDDGLLDFDGGMGMEDSAFGDALHGMDTHTPLAALEGGDEGEQGGS